MGMGKISCLGCVLLFLSVIVGSSANGYGYSDNPTQEAPKKLGNYFIPGVFSVQGIVYCKSGSKVIPLKGTYASSF